MPDFNPFNMITTDLNKEPVASYMSDSYHHGVYGGENTPYELGTPIEFELDYNALRLRAWEAYLKSDIIQNAIRKYVLWVIGAGLKLQCDPLTNSSQKTKYSAEVEATFRLFANLKESTYNNMQNLHEYASEATTTAMLSGDCLCLTRFEKGISTIEVIDGCFVQSPFDRDILNSVEKRGNSIKSGVEVDKKGTHIAYYIKQDNCEYKRILARGKRTGRLQAWLYYGLKHKLTDVRGMSLLTAVLETVKKLDRYKAATVSNAEENSKIPFVFEHNQHSTGENPMINQLAQSYNKGKGTAPETGGHDEISNVQSKIATTTGKQVYNLPPGASLKRNDFESDLNFSEFFGINEDIVYYTIGIPPEIARDRYEGSYSSSRASLKSWEYKLIVDRKKGVSAQFYSPFFESWLDLNVLSQQIKNPELEKALLTGDFMAAAAWKRHRFVGAAVPHIDPLKEINASRRKLGAKYDLIPLSTGDTETELLNTGDFDTIISKAEIELKEANNFQESEENE